jgi:membrane-bound ClpP family serine protease
MEQAKSYKGVGVALVVLGAAFLAFGLLAGEPTFRLIGPLLGFMGVVLLAQAKKRS